MKTEIAEYFVGWLTSFIHWRENEDSEDLKITKEAKCIVRGKEGITRAGRVQGKGLTVRKIRNMSFVEADGGGKQMNIDVVSFATSVQRRLRCSYVIELKKKSKFINIAWSISA